MKNFMDFAQKTFFPKNLLPNSGCGLSTDAAYTRVNTVTNCRQKCFGLLGLISAVVMLGWRYSYVATSNGGLVTIHLIKPYMKPPQ